MDAGAPVAEAKSLIKHLASCNKSTRDKAFKLLKAWLPSQSEIDDDDMKKLWKGLFYCVWHADKAPVQFELINRMSSLLFALQIPMSVHYFSVFLLTMRREWSGIDALRLDKFYLLIRRFMHCFFQFLKKNAWDLELTHCLMGVLEGKAFLADDRFPGNGVNYHIASVFLEEFEPFLPVGSEVLDSVFKPFLSVMSKSQDKILVNKVRSNIFDVLLKKGRSLLEQKKSGESVDDCNQEKEGLGTIALTMGFSEKFYDLGSSPDCIQGNRKVFLSLHPGFFKLEKDLKSSGVKISVPEVSVNGEDEVPNLIPIVGNDTGIAPEEISTGETEVDAEDGNVSASKLSKRARKSKKGSDGSKKKGKRKGERCVDAIQNTHPTAEESVELTNGNDETLSSNGDGSGDFLLTFNETVMSNLQMQFEKVAAEAGMDEGATEESFETPTISKKKRKRVKNTNGQENGNANLSGKDDNGGDVAAKSGEKSAKKVRFSMKNNLVWKPHSPLPPQSLRLPPSATPRGSALKKGVPPGPIREIQPAAKKGKLKKRGLKGIKTISPAIKGLWKLQTMSI